MEKKLIVLDLEGTLLDSNNEISEYSKKRLKELENEGHIIVLSSTGSYTFVKKFYDQIGLTSPFIAEGGACLFNNNGSDVILSIDSNTFKDIINENYSAIYSSFYHYKEHIFIHNKIDKLNFIYGITDSTIIHENDYLKMDLINPNMVFLVVNLNENESFLNNMKKYDNYLTLKEIAKDYMYYIYYLNVKNVNKAYSTLEVMIENHMDESQIIAIGDSNADIELLSLKGETCAMLNSSDEIKRVAKHISKFDNDNDGAIKFIDSILNK